MVTTAQAWLGVACSTCNAQPGHRCVTSTGKPTTAPHYPRLTAAAPKLTPEELAQREHERRQTDAQYNKRTLVRVSFSYSCGCGTDLSEPIPLSEANVWPARAVICDEHDEYAVVTGVDVRLVADEPTMLRILLAAGVDPGSARYVAADQNDDARGLRVRRGRGSGPS